MVGAGRQPERFLRSLVIDEGDGEHAHGYVWVGAYNESRLYQLDPLDGRIIRSVELDLAPFGAVVDSRGRVWVSLGDASLQSVDTTTVRLARSLLTLRSYVMAAVTHMA